MADTGNAEFNEFLDKHWLAIFLVVLILVLSYQIFVDYIIRFKYTGLILLVLKICIRVLSGAFLNIIVLPVLLVAYILQLIYSTASDVYVKIAISKHLTRAVGFDNIFSLDTIDSPAMINVLFKLNGKMNSENFRKYFTDKIINVKSLSGQIQFPKFTQLLHQYGGYCYWKDDEHFDIRNHIYSINIYEMYPELSLRKDVSAQELICRYLEDHGTESVRNGNAPQWEILCIKICDEEFFYLIRIHHSYGDGMSMRRMIIEYLTDEPSAADNITLQTPSLPVRITRILWAISLLPYAIGMVIYKGSCNPLHGPKLNGKKYFVAVPEIPFKLVRDIKMKSKTSVPATLFSAVTNAFGKKFQKSSSKVPWLTGFYPIGVSDPAVELKLENSFMVGVAPLPVPAFKLFDGKLYQENSSFFNLVQTDLALRAAHDDATVLACFYLVLLFGNVIPIFLGRIVSSSSGMTVALSNFPGPLKPVTIMRNKLTEIRIWPPDREPLGIVIVFTSYSGGLRVNITIDDALVKSHEEAEELGRNWLAEIKNVATELDIKDTTV